MTETVLVATLKPECVAEYEALHDGSIGPEPHEIADAGFSRLQINRLGLTLVMIVTGEGGVRTMPEKESRAHDRYLRTEACFAQSWQVAGPVFCIAAVGDGA